MQDAAPAQIAYRANGLRFGALAWGPEAGPLALCLHGYPDTAWTWRRMAPLLASHGWRVVAPFLRGYAPTEVAPDDRYAVRDLAADVVAAHAALGGDRRTLLVGHDWGALAAYAAAGIAPELFPRVVTLAVPPVPLLRHALLGSDRAGLTLRQARRSWYILFQQAPGISDALLPWLVGRLWADWSPGYDAGEELRHLEQALDGRMRRRAALRYYRALWRLRPREVRAPDQPWLYLHGREDGCMGAELVERGRDRFPNSARVEILERCGHFLQLERPDVVTRSIAGFASPAPADAGGATQGRFVS